MYKLAITTFIFLLLLISPRGRQQVSGQIIGGDINWRRFSTSGARSAHPVEALTPFGDTFNLFNLFNVFRGSKSKLLDENGDLMPFDENIRVSSDNIEQVFNGESKSDEMTFIDLFRNLKFKFESKEMNSNKDVQSEAQQIVLSPVILIPGYGGSRLEARLNKPSVVRYFCDIKSDWEDLWINVKLLLPYMIDCLIDNLRLEFDQSTNTTRNTRGVEVRVKNATQISSVEYLSNQLPIAGFAYFAPIIEKLVHSNGYKRELSIRGAAYDFRKAPNELGEYFDQLKKTSEQMLAENSLNPITYICHSMGCNNLLYFLQNQTQKWKDKHVKRLVSIAAPWGGSVSAMRAAALGDDLGMPYLFSESKLIQIQRSLPSTIYMFPHTKVFSDVPLIKTNTDLDSASMLLQATNSSYYSANTVSPREPAERTYMAHDFKQFFDDINHPDGYRIWLNTKDLLGSLEAPGVEVWCLVGRGQKTLGRMEYKGEFPSSSGLEIYDDGDGTVNLGSANFCTNWSKEQKQSVHYKEFNVGHMEILRDPRAVQYIQSILNSETGSKI